MSLQVFGVQDERLGEEICAWILLKPDSNVTVEDVKQYCKNKLSAFKIPKYITFVNNFPKTPSGKIQKGRMSEIMSAELA